MPHEEDDSANHVGDSSGDDDYVDDSRSQDADGSDVDELEHDDGIYEDDHSYYYGGDGEKWDELARQLFPGQPLPRPGH
eukprot:15474470-Alexandrium_andersonii.AAC.1